MNTKTILTASALVMGATGIAGSFAPGEIATLLGYGSLSGLKIVLQLLAALYFAFAMLNWLARGSLIGGIYNRPVAVANVTHFVVGALALAKLVAAGERRPALLVAAALYILFAIAFGAMLRRSPVARVEPGQD